MENDLSTLHEKIDLLTAQVLAQQGQIALLVQVAEAQRRQQAEFQELKGDVMPIVNHMVKLSINELAEVGTDFQVEDLLFLLKRGLRDTALLVDGLNRLEMMMDLYDEGQRLGKQVFSQAVTEMDRLEREGYFAMARGGWKMVERLVHEFDEKDVEALGDNLVAALQALQAPPDEKTSMLTLLKELSDPQTRRGMARLLRVLKILGGHSSPS